MRGIVCRHLHSSASNESTPALSISAPELSRLSLSVGARMSISLLPAMGVGGLPDDDFSDFEQQLESFRDFDKRRENFFTVSPHTALAPLDAIC